MSAAEIAAALADKVDELALDLFGPPSMKSAVEWRWRNKGSLAVYLSPAPRRGHWRDFEADERGDALDLVAWSRGCSLKDAYRWAREWLGNPTAAARTTPPRQAPAAAPALASDAWRRAWSRGGPNQNTIADHYLGGRAATYADAQGEVLRFDPRCARLAPETDILEHRPALLSLLRDALTGQPCGIQRTFLQPDGADRIRDSKSKATLGRAHGAAVMLSPFDEPTHGLVLVEGLESAISVLNSGVRPVWATAGTSGLRAMPLLGGIETINIMGDNDAAGIRAAEACAARWRAAGREARIIHPTRAGADWNDAWREIAA